MRSTTFLPAAQKALSGYKIWQVILAATFGTMIEWYDYFIFGSLTTLLAFGLVISAVLLAFASRPQDAGNWRSTGTRPRGVTHIHFTHAASPSFQY